MTQTDIVIPLDDGQTLRVGPDRYAPERWVLETTRGNVGNVAELSPDGAARLIAILRAGADAPDPAPPTPAGPAMPLIDHFAVRLPPGDPPPVDGDVVVLASLAELERAARDPACAAIRVWVSGLGFLAVSKAALRDLLTTNRRRNRPALRFPVTVATVGLGTELHFDPVRAKNARDRVRAGDVPGVDAADVMV